MDNNTAIGILKAILPGTDNDIRKAINMGIDSLKGKNNSRKEINIKVTHIMPKFPVSLEDSPFNELFDKFFKDNDKPSLG